MYKSFIKKVTAIIFIITLLINTFPILVNAKTATPNPKKTLVVYFSMPETKKPKNMTEEEKNSTVIINGKVLGNTQYVAQIIKQYTGGDVFRINPKNPYPTDHKKLVDQAEKEQSDNARPEISNTVKNIDKYDTVFIGYPNWWGDMPMILYSFLEKYDLSGKTIIPFITHGGSGFSDTINSIVALQPNAIVKRNGLSISRDDVQDSKPTVIKWVKKFGYKDARNVKLKKIKLNTSRKTMTIGDKITLKVKSVTPTNASKKVTWKTSRKSIATINKSGVVKTKKVGTVKIKATSTKNKKVTAVCKINIIPKPKKIKLSTSRKTMTMSDKFTLKVKSVSPKKASKKVTWKSNKKSIVTVSKSGVITTKKAGTVEITATSVKNKKATAICKITVKKKDNPNNTPPPKNDPQKTKSLVVYFSMPETTNPDNMTQEEENSAVVIDGEVLGNTQYMAYVIQKNTGSDIFRIEPDTPYPTDHATLVDLARKEQQENTRPKIKDIIEDFDSYDTVFVGYPNWWADMPMILYTFFDTYDFSDKTIVTFNTHGGSGFSDTNKTIQNLEPDAAVVKGLSISRNDIEDAEADIVDWLKGLGYNK